MWSVGIDLVSLERCQSLLGRQFADRPSAHVVQQFATSWACREAIIKSLSNGGVSIGLRHIRLYKDFVGRRSFSLTVENAQIHLQDLLSLPEIGFVTSQEILVLEKDQTAPLALVEVFPPSFRMISEGLDSLAPNSTGKKASAELSSCRHVKLEASLSVTHEGDFVMAVCNSCLTGITR